MTSKNDENRSSEILIKNTKIHNARSLTIMKLIIIHWTVGWTFTNWLIYNIWKTRICIMRNKRNVYDQSERSGKENDIRAIILRFRQTCVYIIILTYKPVWCARLVQYMHNDPIMFHLITVYCMRLPNKCLDFQII